MMTTPVLEIVEVKQNGKWIPEHTITDETEIYKDLTSALISKKILNHTWVKSIKHVPMYDGSQKIIATYDNDVRYIFIIED